ncbi:hypothetical protein ABZ635_26070 [Nocardiopsis sp. NPDC007018]|uniref:hypothetical protein n=1 Tax=Nocardiopsis sp. NPDC007018 TaxID=3155721 RepID=UPI0033EEFED7
MTEIAIRQDNLDKRIAYAKALAEADMLPKEYRRKPANVLYAVDYGQSLGLDAVQAMNSVHVIEGKPSPSSGLISAMVRRAGHRLRVKVERGQAGPVAIAQIIRSDDPEWTFESRWDMDRARKAGVAGKNVWKAYPEAMLKARAITEVAREACEEALLGFSHSAEEMGAEVDADGNVLDVAPAQKRAGATIAEAVAETEAADPEKPPVDLELMNQMGRLMRMLGFGREEALPFASEVVGREVTSRADLSEAEVSKVIEALDARLQERDRQAEDPEIADAEVVPEDEATYGEYVGAES